MFATVNDLYEAASSEIGDQGGIFIDIVDVIRWYNEAILDIYVNAELGRDTPTTYPLVLGATTVTGLSALRLQKIHSLVINGVPLIQTTLDELYRTVGYNIDFTLRGQPRYYWREFQADVSQSVIKFWPTCEVACNAILSATILPTPIPMSIASASVALNQIPVVYHPDLLKFVVMRGNMKEKDFRASELLERQYKEGAFARFDNAHEVAEDFSTIQPDGLDSGYLL
jgi:hypothetical protein